jgi:hypothetical protein
LDQIAFDALSSVVLAVMIKIHVYSEPSGSSDTELTICQGITRIKSQPRTKYKYNFLPNLSPSLLDNQILCRGCHGRRKKSFIYEEANLSTS